MFKTVSENLAKLGYSIQCFKTVAAANEYLNKAIDGVTVGIGGSVTVAEMELCPQLSAHNTVYWHQGVADKEKSLEIRKNAAQAQVYISSVNGIAESGEIINIDGNCNRVSAIFYGHEKVYLIAGKNKLAPDYEKALYRARNIAAPLNAKRLNMNTPCAKSGKCHNCQSPQRICRGLSVLWSKPMCCDFEIILIEENLGY